MGRLVCVWLGWVGDSLSVPGLVQVTKGFARHSIDLY